MVENNSTLLLLADSTFLLAIFTMLLALATVILAVNSYINGIKQRRMTFLLNQLEYFYLPLKNFLEKSLKSRPILYGKNLPAKERAFFENLDNKVHLCDVGLYPLYSEYSESITYKDIINFDITERALVLFSILSKEVAIKTKELQMLSTNFISKYRYRKEHKEFMTKLQKEIDRVEESKNISRNDFK